MSAQLPDWNPFTSGDRPPALDVIEPGSVVALVAPSGTAGDSWAAPMAFDLATGWADQGHKVVMVDVALESPSLHQEAGLVNAEGLVDAACFGASVARVARAVPKRPFYLVTAGSPAADGSIVARSPRMARLVSGFGEAGVTLLLFVREDGSGADDFLGYARDVVLLAASPGSVPSVPEGLAASVRAVVGPDAAAADPVVLPEAGPTTVPGLDGGVPSTEVDETDPFVAPGHAAGAEEVAEEPMSFTSLPEQADEDAPVATPVEPDGPMLSERAPAHTHPGGSRTADPNARSKLLLVGLVVVLIALLVVLGALRG